MGIQPGFYTSEASPITPVKPQSRFYTRGPPPTTQVEPQTGINTKEAPPHCSASLFDSAILWVVQPLPPTAITRDLEGVLIYGARIEDTPAAGALGMPHLSPTSVGFCGGALSIALKLEPLATSRRRVSREIKIFSI